MLEKLLLLLAVFAKINFTTPLSETTNEAFQSEIKSIVAKYLVDTTMVEDGIESRLEVEGPIPYGKHHGHRQKDRYEQLLQRLQEQEKQLQQLKQTGSAPPVPLPATNLQAKQEPISATQPSAAPKQEESVSTQIPIILTSTVSLPIATASVAPAAAVAVTTPIPTTLRPTVDPVHHINQVNKILGNVANGNIVGIVDESLAIRAPPPVRNLVTNIMKVIFCNPIDRLFGRCAPNQIDAANNSVKG